MTLIPIFDGHNDAVHKLREYLGPVSDPAGIDFLAANTTGHLDLPRARAGGLFGGFFAMWVSGEHTKHHGGYVLPPKPSNTLFQQQ